MSKQTKLWNERSGLKRELLERGDNEISGMALNVAAGLPPDKVMPKRMFGL